MSEMRHLVHRKCGRNGRAVGCSITVVTVTRRLEVGGGALSGPRPH